METYIYTSLLLTLVCGALHVEALSKCNPGIEANIKNYWGGKYPEKVIERELAIRDNLVVATTEGYYSSDVDCVRSVYYDEPKYRPVIVSNITYRYKDGSEATNQHYIGEFEGITFDVCNQVKRYHVCLTDSGVEGVYACSVAPDAVEGKVDGLVKVPLKNYAEALEDVPFVKEELSKVGINTNTDCSQTCTEWNPKQ